MNTGFNHIVWKNNTLYLLDQRKLPLHEEMVECKTVEAVIEAIKCMVVRGAPAIGIVAAYAAVISVNSYLDESESNREIEWREAIATDLDQIEQARPTAVNLMWAVNEMRQLLISVEAKDACNRAHELAVKIHREDIESNTRMAEMACELFADSEGAAFSVITHCNTGSLATGGYGTALGVIRKAWERKLIDQVYADETRPWLQGARLTAWELQRDGVPVTLNADGAAAWLMAEKNIRWAIVGADRITANGDVANKIGTYALAIQARYHGVKFMVVAPSSTIDMQLASGKDIEIEMRTEHELTQFTGHRVAPEGIDVINPVFDVTPATLIDAIVTDKGVVLNPDENSMAALFGESEQD